MYCSKYPVYILIGKYCLYCSKYPEYTIHIGKYCVYSSVNILYKFFLINILFIVLYYIYPET